MAGPWASPPVFWGGIINVERNQSRSGYLPSLDGWRCIAIIGVMWAHDARRVVFGHHTDLYQGMGGYGVHLFFAISGILISWRILQEEQKTGTFSLKSFYVRRFFRIQPAQWAYLSVVALLMLLRVLPTARWKYWWAALLLVENFVWHNLHRDVLVPASYLVGHFWTLAAEEHFYLLISLFYFLVKQRRALVLSLLLGALVLWQGIAVNLGRFSVDVSDRRTYWVLQFMVFPALLALLLHRPEVLAFAERWWKPWVAFGSTAIIMYTHQLLYTPVLRFALKPMLTLNVYPLLLCFSGWVIATMLHPQSWTTRFLELRWIRFVGRISYSLYLWHLLFFGGGAPERCTWRVLTFLNTPPRHYICAFLCAVASYYLIEKPAIRLGHRLAPPATPGHRDLAVEVPVLSAV